MPENLISKTTGESILLSRTAFLRMNLLMKSEILITCLIDSGLL